MCKTGAGGGSPSRTQERALYIAIVLFDLGHSSLRRSYAENWVFFRQKRVALAATRKTVFFICYSACLCDKLSAGV